MTQGCLLIEFQFLECKYIHMQNVWTVKGVRV